jgi:ketosteroid isomerase-like protein
MSQENVDKTNAYMEAYNRRDFDAATEHFDPDVEWILPDQQRSDSGRGVEAVLRFWASVDETFDELLLKPQESIDAGDRVATRLRHYGRGKVSGAVIDSPLYHQVITFSDGKMVRIEYFKTWEEAREAAGVRD